MKLVDPKTEINIPVNVQNVSPNIEYWPIDDLPSNYKLYPDGTKIIGRPLKVIEVKKLGSLTIDNYQYVINEVIRSSIKGINIDELNLNDKFYIILWLRSNTYREPGYAQKFICDACNKESTYEFDLNKLEVQYLSDSFNPIYKLSNGDNIIWDFLRIKDEEAIKLYKDKNKDVDDDILQLSFMIKSINDKTVKPSFVYDYLTEKLDAGSYIQLEKHIKKFNFGIKNSINCVCSHCKEERPIGISFRTDFFIPEYINS